MKNTGLIPKDGIEGLKENWKSDFLSGFMIFLLAMPLSLGIADQSKFPAVFGLVTAIIGGMLVSIIAGSRLTIKGPAAGLAPIVGGAVIAFGDGEMGWKLACGAIVVAAIFQVLFGVLKLGSMSDFFPVSAIHGMLAAIGILIFAKQFHNLLGIPGPKLVDDAGKALKPLGLLTHIPNSIMNLNPQITIIGVLSLLVVFGIPYIKNRYVKLVPMPVIVLAIAIPLGIIFNLKQDNPKSLILIGNFIDQIVSGFQGNNISFAGISSNTGTFIQYVLLFSLIGSIESLLTVKAIDGLDPYHRKSNYNKDLIAVGLGNIFSGLLGGLPMISEVARSSANVNSGAKTRWANFFHGFWLLVCVLLISSVLEMIPKTALAALLIGVAYRLANPKLFINTFKIGKEQLAVFLITIIVTIVEDLLMGVIAGIVLEFILNMVFAKSPKNIFKADFKTEKESDDRYTIVLKGALTFSNFMSLKKEIHGLPEKSHIKLDMSQTTFIDHGAIEQLRHLEEEIHHLGGVLLEFNKVHLGRMGSHRLSGLRNKAHLGAEQELPVLKERELLAKDLNYEFVEFAKNEIRDKFSRFYLYKKMKVVESAIMGKTEGSEISIVDFVSQEQLGLSTREIHSTIFLVRTQLSIPNFALEVEGEADILTNAGKDIDFEKFPDFSGFYLLRGEKEADIRTFFTKEVIKFFEEEKDYLVEAIDGVLLIKVNANHLSNEDVKASMLYIHNLLEVFEKSASPAMK
jgi:MFS superfamily sulfate permease-like transporter